MIEELRRIGLSDLEARCYLTLHEEQGLSGYEVAKRVSVSRTNVYAALRSLTDKGMCRVVESEPVIYDAVPIEQLIRLLKSDFDQTARTLTEQLQTAPRPSSAFYSWQGAKAIEMAIRRLTANADKHIVADIWAEDLYWVEKSLLEAENRGIAVTLITIGDCRTGLRNVFKHKRSEAWGQAESRKFSLLCDSRSALLGSFGKLHKLSVLETDHPSLAELLQSGFYHDVIMERIEQDFGAELTERYGEDYERILGPYKEYL
ncbi:Sugar-specific transcriptional regulator TrmB [Paenibacillus sp. UNCCL117]|uniref:TrmB family transcriptional regulator n=1 Tax=unclassified Paenibacillus TaxID=185978 RepID=UPI000886E229|nr:MULTISPECIES: TrmB family transcriptional regulator [unclassified Paenibacillus]SDD11681.1 Sugar-specific transcriptional regulator TrmB [Paenibacillus sp. cl123]SFW33622.1 Sugar-specific transcriptional regulator TrmB [Paenibacillus sp. UNCCL117]